MCLFFLLGILVPFNVCFSSFQPSFFVENTSDAFKQRSSRFHGDEKGRDPDCTPENHQEVTLSETQETLADFGEFMGIFISQPEILGRFLDVLDIVDMARMAQVDKKTHEAMAQNDVWKMIGKRFYGCYLSSESLDKKAQVLVKNHFLSVLINLQQEGPDDGYHLARQNKKIFFDENYHAYDYIPMGIYRALLPSRHFSVIPSFLSLKKLLLKKGLENILQKGDSHPLYEKALKTKLKALLYGDIATIYGYEKNWDHAEEILKLCLPMDDEAFYKAFVRAFAAEKKPLPPSLKAWVCVQNNQWSAMHYKIECLSKGIHGFPKRPKQARNLNEKMIRKGSYRALKRKVLALCDGDYGYEENLKKARMLIESSIKKGHEEKMSLYKVTGLKFGAYGYEKNEGHAHKLLEDLCKKGYHKAMNLMVTYVSWDPRSDKDIKHARDFHEKLIKAMDEEAIKQKMNHLWALEAKATSFVTESYSAFVIQMAYKGSLSACMRLNDAHSLPTTHPSWHAIWQQYDEGDAEEEAWRDLYYWNPIRNDFFPGDPFFHVKMQAYRGAMHESQLKAFDLQKKLVKQGHLMAVLRKIMGLHLMTNTDLQGRSFFNLYDTYNQGGDPCYGYNLTSEFNANAHKDLKDFIESLTTCENSLARGLGHILKVRDLKQQEAYSGITGEDLPWSQIVDYIKKYHVPF